MNNRKKIKQMVGLASIAAIIVVVQLLSNVIKIGIASVTLALIPIVVGAILYGPKGGFLLGIVHGIVCAFYANEFMAYNVFFTIFVCLLKSGMAGLISGYLYLILRKKSEKLGIVFSAISAPVINTGIYLVACFTVFYPLMEQTASAEGINVIKYLLTITFLFNFLIEFFVNAVLSPMVIYIVRIFQTKQRN